MANEIKFDSDDELTVDTKFILYCSLMVLGMLSFLASSNNFVMTYWHGKAIFSVYSAMIFVLVLTSL